MARPVMLADARAMEELERQERLRGLIEDARAEIARSKKLSAESLEKVSDARRVIARARGVRRA